MKIIKCSVCGKIFSGMGQMYTHGIAKEDPCKKTTSLEQTKKLPSPNNASGT